MAYIVDVSKLTISNGNPDGFFLYHYPDASGNKRLVPINKVLFGYDNSNKQNINEFADTNGNSHDTNTKYISGTVRTADNLWEHTESLTAYTKSSMPEFVARGSFPQFKKCIDFGPGDYTLKINNNQTCFEIGDLPLTADLFKDGILPDRMLLIMQAGGGGGGGCGECALAYANDAGGGGGGGA